MNRITAIAIALLIVLNGFGQDTLSTLKHNDAVLDVIRIVKVRYNDYAIRTDQVDSTQSRIQQAGTLADLLGGNLLNTKAYTPGGLATTGIRGSNSMQTPVFWNGISLQNVTNNTVDLSLLPVFLFDRITVRPGGSSASWGNGAIGGAIDLQMHSAQYDGKGQMLNGDFFKLRSVSEAGGFGTMKYGLQLAAARDRWNCDVKMYRQQGDNDFTFQNLTQPGRPLDTLRHAGYYQHGVMSEFGYRSKNHKDDFSAALWWQETFRNLPANMFADDNEETQQDYALRAMGTWMHRFTTPLYWLTKAVVIHEGLLYNPGNQMVMNNTDAWTYIVQSGLSYNTRGDRWYNRNVGYQLNINSTYFTAEVTDAIPFTSQHRLALFGAVTKNMRSEDVLALSFREELIDNKLIEPVGSLSYYALIKKWIGIKANAAHSYRVPTFNDLFWTPGGNPDLVAERSWTEEITLELHSDLRTIFGGLNWKLDYAVTVYNRNVYNMIQWTPSASYWSPQNIGEVWSRGVEHRMNMVVKNAAWKFTLIGTADYIRSTAEKTATVNDPALHKQLIYIPALFGSVAFTADWKNFYFTGAWQYTDHRFTTRDHVEYLPAYHLFNAAIGNEQSFDIANNSYSLNVFFRANNILNEQYQSVAWRPMPGRNFSLGLSVSWIKQKKTVSNIITTD